MMKRFSTITFLLLIFATFVACSEGATIDVFPPNPDGGSSNVVPGSDAGADATDAVPDGGAATAKCGNGKVETGEACDDGNTNDNDGCSATCKLESAFEGDTCPGKAISLVKTGTSWKATVNGSTKGAFNHYSSACGGGSGRDVVYTFTPSSSGKAIVRLTADFAAIVSARSTCETATSESKCNDIAQSTGGTATMEVPVFANTPAYLFIDGYGGSSGAFTLDVDVSEAVCGNGIAELPEACDDGNTTNGDGCSSTCTVEEGGVINQCPGQPFLLTGARKISFAGNTLTDGAQTQNSTGCFYQGGSNVVYALKSDVSGSAKAVLTSGYAKANVHARSDCGSSSFQLGCTQIEAPGNARIDFPVVAGEWFYVFVDGHRDGSKDFAGPYSLDVSVTPAACGNGTIDGAEECDDGNTADGDGCSSTCKREALAGDNACPGHALTLDSTTHKATVSSTTTGHANAVGPCGALQGTSGGDSIFAVTPDIDGLLTANVVGAFNSTVGIQTACAGGTWLACSWAASASTDPFTLTGLGSIPKSARAAVKAGTTYWVVVDSSSSSGTQASGVFKLDVEVTPATCGNGVIEGAEQCDDGNTSANDGCDATCQIEPITARSTCADAEAITLVEGSTAGHWSASLARGTTNLLANANFFTSTLDDDEACWAPGKNAFFSVTAPAAGVLRATAKSAAFDVVLGLRKPTCILTGPALACANDSGTGNEESVATPVAAGEQVWLVVDSKSATDAGAFTLDVSIEPSGCGDGFFVAGPNEECDDGNALNGDGCSATCKLEPLANVDKCPGATLTLASSSASTARGTITFNTANLSADYSGACGGSSREGVVRVVAPINGTLRARMRGMPGATVYARTVCIDPTTELFKSSFSTCTNVVHDVVTFQATSGTEYFLFVDGLEGATGVPTLDVSISP